MARRGRKRRLELESEFWKHLVAGLGPVEAARRVGIGRKTGYRWRAEAGGTPPERLDEDVRSERYLSLLERQRIAALRRNRLSIREIALLLRRSPSTISRELRRNRAPHDVAYDGDLAHARARARGRRLRPARMSRDQQLRAAVMSRLELEWSPEQIAVWLREAHPDRPDWHLCHESIYQAIYRGALPRITARKLRTGRSLRRPRRRIASSGVRFVVPSLLITHRPAAAATRERIGDWEGDLICGTKHHSAIGTLVERRTRYVRLVHLPAGHAALTFAAAITPVLLSLPEALRRTLTWDQGIEMARHDLFAGLFSEGVFFAPPASPWLRGTNENTNGLLRQYFPKGTDLSIHGPDDLAHAENRLNHRPRKTLGWKTPAQCLAELLAAGA